MSGKKPHKEEWDLDGDGDVRRKSARGVRTSLVCLKAATGSLEAQALISAAPDMARALLATLTNNGHLPSCDAALGHTCRVDSECHRFRAALTKAGVLL